MGGAYSDVVVRLAARDRRQLAADFVALTKPRVVLMVLVTTLMGYDVALTGPADYLRMIHLLIGSLLAAGRALPLNQSRERDLDARMDRTRARPLPAGRLQPLEAWLFGVALTLLGTAYLAALVNPLVALVTLATTILYLFAYTPLKRRTPLCTLVGAVAGALPPVAGWGRSISPARWCWGSHSPRSGSSRPWCRPRAPRVTSCSLRSFICPCSWG